MRQLCLCLELIFLFAGSLETHAQDSTQLRYIITTQPFQNAFLDFPVKVERLFRRQAVGITLGYRPATARGGSISDYPFAAYMDMNMQNSLYNAFTLGGSSKYFLGKQSNLFLEAELFYRHWWFTDKVCSFNLANAYRFSGTRTERQNVFGAKILFGSTLIRPSSNRIKMVVEIFGGVGFRAKMYHFETRNGTVKDKYYTYYVEEGNWKNAPTDIGFLHLVTPQLGVRLGIGL